MKFLCIDWGNTQVKAALFTDDGQLSNRWQFDTPPSPEDLSARLREAPAAIILSATGEVPEATRTWLQEQAFFLNLTGNTRTPLINAYYSQDTLGPDRLAAAVAMQHQYPEGNNLVICAGTCITYNFVSHQNTFRGGAIAPGVQMRLDAMHQFTARLPQVDAYGYTLLLGYDTETCMRSGALMGAAFEIEATVAAYRAQYPLFNAVLTGGDAPLLARHLKSGIFADPDLILKGLYLILKQHAPTTR